MSIKKLFSLIILVLGITAITTGCFYHETSPRIKEGKFNFSVTYEIDGEVNTLSGVYVAKFVKIGQAIDCAYRIWDGYVETDAVRNLLVKDCTYMILKHTEDGDIYLDFNLYPQFFLAEPGYEAIKGDEPDLYIEYNEQASDRCETYRSDDPEVLMGYGVKIISFNYDKPIENIYE